MNHGYVFHCVQSRKGRSGAWSRAGSTGRSGRPNAGVGQPGELLSSVVASVLFRMNGLGR